MEKIFFVHFPHDTDTKVLVSNMLAQGSVVDELIEDLSKRNIVAHKGKGDVSMYHHISIQNFKPQHETLLVMLVSEYEYFYIEEHNG
jgi:hypothetical protein|tara:strand:+ start:1151 stop:1411 length:261 start_codon:yes stop_codon:yes gene_type:complete